MWKVYKHIFSLSSEMEDADCASILIDIDSVILEISSVIMYIKIISVWLVLPDRRSRFTD